MKYYLAIDIGASSGRHILGWNDGDKFCHEEIYRFENGVKTVGNIKTWDIEKLTNEVIFGMKVCAGLDIIPESVAIDTWAVDYVLLDKEDKPILPVYSYRDDRGISASSILHSTIPFNQLYEKTGIQYQEFNTIYQLHDDLSIGRLKHAKNFLMIPEYLSFILTGNKCCEYTNATSTGIINAKTKTWDNDIIEKSGIPKRLFKKQPQSPPHFCGRLTDDIKKQVGYDCTVLMVASHDTASAVTALPSNKPCMYISSGTWSLLGIEFSKPVITKEGMENNFTNEGSMNGIRIQKNIMGLWLIQCLRKQYGDTYSFSEIAELARNNNSFDYKLEINSDKYFIPESITDVIDSECTEKGYPLPKDIGAYAYAILNSLAHSYNDTIQQILKLTGMNFLEIYIIGGGSDNVFLNELTELRTGKKVVKGSSEATALGNIALQALYADEVKSIEEMKEKIINVEG